MSKQPASAMDAAAASASSAEATGLARFSLGANARTSENTSKSTNDRTGDRKALRTNG
jgi:hypothetical protein